MRRSKELWEWQCTVSCKSQVFTRDRSTVRIKTWKGTQANMRIIKSRSDNWKRTESCESQVFSRDRSAVGRGAVGGVEAHRHVSCIFCSLDVVAVLLWVPNFVLLFVVEVAVRRGIVVLFLWVAILFPLLLIFSILFTYYVRGLLVGVDEDLLDVDQVNLKGALFVCWHWWRPRWLCTHGSERQAWDNNGVFWSTLAHIGSWVPLVG